MKSPVAASLFLLAVTTAHAGLPQTWNFDETTTGQDIQWTSPTAVNPSAELFAGVYEITLIEVTVDVGFPITLDVTGQAPPELLIGTGDAVGPAPVTLADLPVLFPDPPEPTAVAADISVSLNADGFGTLTATNVVLGTFDSGFPFGVVPITALRIAGSVEVLPTSLADVNRDNRVNVNDLVEVVTAWGLCPAEPETCPADITLDGEVGVDDLVEVILNWGK